MPKHEPFTAQNNYTFDWSGLAFGSKKPLKELGAIFIAAPREISVTRFTQLIKTYLPKNHIVLGLSKEPYVLDLENQPQFKMLRGEVVQPLIDKVNAASSKHKIYTLKYSQRDLPFILEKIPFKHTVLIQGSWYKAFHFRPEYYKLAASRAPYEMISPFADEQEAVDYVAQITLLPSPKPGVYTETEMLGLARAAAARSFDYGGFQTGVVLGRRSNTRKGSYELVTSAHNKVVPFETYAMHYGASREKNFSPMNDLNHYDTIHAEIGLMITAQKQRLDLNGTTLFINLLPCPMCARMFTETSITEFIYQEDHTSGYAVAMLEKAGKKVRRIVPAVSEV